MPVDFYTDLRKLKKQQFLEFIKGNPDIPIEKICAIFSMKTGNKATTLKIYYNELKEAGLIE